MGSGPLLFELVIVRREHRTDRAASRAVHVAAFDRGDGEPAEARLLDALRDCEGWLPALSWVAEIDGRVVGHNVCTRGHVSGVPCVGLGPIGVLPACQQDGIGSALMHAMIGAADAAGEPLIVLLGDPGYYSRFGFVESTMHGVTPPQEQWGSHFQLLRLSAWDESIIGTFRYAAPFDDIT
jgi:putative acetyltransferase